MRVNCKTCKQDVESYLSLLPRLWRKKVAEIVCKYIICGKDDINCEDLTNCQTVTSLSEFTVSGTEICIQYVDENNVTVTRCFNLAEGFNNSLESLDPNCLATAEDWSNMTYLQKMQSIIDKACEECEETTTTTTTSEVTTTTTTTSEVTTTTTTTEEATTTTTTTELYDYYFANQRSCDDCGTVDSVEVVKFFAGTGVVIGDFYIDVPFDGNTYELISLTTPQAAIDLSISSHSGSCAVSCADGATTTTSTTAAPTTTTTTTASPTTTTTTTEEVTTTTTTTAEATTTTTTTGEALNYIAYFADRYDCSDCLVESSVEIAFVDSYTPDSSKWYNTGVPNGFSYKINGGVSPGPGLIMDTTPYNSCGLGCAI